MRALIRPTLFMIARLGLFLAVVAWGTSQELQFELRSTSGASKTTGGLNSQGWYAVCDGPYLAATFPEMSSGPFDEFYEGLWFEIPVAIPGIFDRVYSLLGLTITTGPLKVISARHWLLVSIFALFNGVLMFIYRKRPEVKPCEV